MNVKKMSTAQIVTKLNQMTDVPVNVIEGIAREDLVIHLTDLLNGDTDAPDFYNAVMGIENEATELFVPGLTDEEVDSPNSMSANEAVSARTIAVEETMPEDCIAHKEAPAATRTARYEDPKLRKAYRTKCRAIANKLNVAWEQTEAGDYLIDGKLYTFDDFIANHK